MKCIKRQLNNWLVILFSIYFTTNAIAASSTHKEYDRLEALLLILDPEKSPGMIYAFDLETENGVFQQRLFMSTKGQCKIKINGNIVQAKLDLAENHYLAEGHPERTTGWLNDTGLSNLTIHRPIKTLKAIFTINKKELNQWDEDSLDITIGGATRSCQPIPYDSKGKTRSFRLIGTSSPNSICQLLQFDKHIIQDGIKYKLPEIRYTFRNTEITTSDHESIGPWPTLTEDHAPLTIHTDATTAPIYTTHTTGEVLRKIGSKKIPDFLLSATIAYFPKKQSFSVTYKVDDGQQPLDASLVNRLTYCILHKDELPNEQELDVQETPNAALRGFRSSPLTPAQVSPGFHTLKIDRSSDQPTKGAKKWYSNTSDGFNQFLAKMKENPEQPNNYFLCLRLDGDDFYSKLFQAQYFIKPILQFQLPSLKDQENTLSRKKSDIQQAARLEDIYLFSVDYDWKDKQLAAKLVKQEQWISEEVSALKASNRQSQKDLLEQKDATERKLSAMRAEIDQNNLTLSQTQHRNLQLTTENQELKQQVNTLLTPKSQKPFLVHKPLTKNNYETNSHQSRSRPPTGTTFHPQKRAPHVNASLAEQKRLQQYLDIPDDADLKSMAPDLDLEAQRKAYPTHSSIERLTAMQNTYRTKLDRLATFANWGSYRPNPEQELFYATPDELSDYGFRYFDEEDVVYCVHPDCDFYFRNQSGIKSWKPTDRPYREHRENAPYCPLIINKEEAKKYEVPWHGDDD